MATATINPHRGPMADIGVSKEREPQQAPAARPAIPAGTTLVSTDGHLNVAEDLWLERAHLAPAHIRDRLPRVWYDKINNLWQIEIDGKPAFLDHTVQEIIRTLDRPGSYDIVQRVKELEAEGVTKEIAFPNLIGVLYYYPDLEVREWILRIYNLFLADLQARAPGRFYGVAVLPWWDERAARESLAELKAAGLKTLMLPINPGKNGAGEPIFYTSPEMDFLWAAIEQSGLPVCFHIGEGLVPYGPVNGVAILAMMSFTSTGFRRVFGELTFGGVFDRHPGLRVVFTEAGLHWVPGMLQDGEMIYDSFWGLAQRPMRRPSEYWSKHCYATFMYDPAGLERLHRIGADRVMWSTDYPHNESTLGYGWNAIQAVLDKTSPEDARKILGNTALEVFDLK